MRAEPEGREKTNLQANDDLKDRLQQVESFLDEVDAESDSSNSNDESSSPSHDKSE